MIKYFLVVVFSLSLFAVDNFGQELTPRKWLEMSFGGAMPGCEEFRAKMDLYASEIENAPGSVGVVIAYEGKSTLRRPGRRPAIMLPVRGESAYHIRTLLRYFNFRRLASDRYLFVDGGYREFQTIEFWVVPEGAKLPHALPTLDSMKYRKGTPLADYSCSGEG